MKSVFSVGLLKKKIFYLTMYIVTLTTLIVKADLKNLHLKKNVTNFLTTKKDDTLHSFLV